MKSKVLGLSLVAALGLVAAGPVSADGQKPINGNIELTLVLEICPERPLPLLSWVGTAAIDGETYGWADFPNPPGPPVVDGNFGRFVEYWTIFTLDGSEDLTSAACDPDRVLLAGDNTGWGSTTGNNGRADGTVTFADPDGPFAGVELGSRMFWRGKVLGGPPVPGSEFKATLHIHPSR